jgi:hypothetical protein
VCGGLPASADWRDSVTFTASDRVRGEFVDWFDPPAGAADDGAQRYAFFANQLRAGVRVDLPNLQFVVEGQDTRLASLPDDATLPAPQGSLGPGATYFQSTRDTSQGEAFLKQGFVAVRGRGFTAKAGRFEYRDGAETVPGDATLAFLKRVRINERIVGPFDFTHVTRSFDGGPGRLRRARLERDGDRAAADARRLRGERESRARRREPRGPVAHGEAAAVRERAAGGSAPLLSLLRGPPQRAGQGRQPRARGARG